MRGCLLLFIVLGACAPGSPGQNGSSIGAERPALLRCSLGPATGDDPGSDVITLTCASVAPPAPLVYVDGDVETLDAQGNAQSLALPMAGVPLTERFRVGQLPLTIVRAQYVQNTGDAGMGWSSLGVLDDDTRHPLASPGAVYTMSQPYDVWTLHVASDATRAIWTSYDLSIAPLSSAVTMSSTVQAGASVLVQAGATATLVLAVPPGASSVTLQFTDAMCGSGQLWDGNQCVACGSSGAPACPSGSVTGSGDWQLAGDMLAPGSSSAPPPDMAPPPDLTPPPSTTPPPDMSPPPAPTCGTDTTPVCSDGSCAMGFVFSALSGCVPCGQLNEPACADGTCDSGFVLSSFSGCVACGQLNEPACADGTCDPGFVLSSSSGCVPCGQSNEPACADGSCDPGFVLTSSSGCQPAT
jgi:hypothetical protein